MVWIRPKGAGVRRNLLITSLVSSLLSLAVLAPPLPGDAPSPGAAPAPDFQREVRPILADHCFACHGPDAAKRQANLRLDTREGLFGRLPAGPAVVKGRPEASRAWLRIAAADPARRMPPPSFEKSLTAAQKATLRRWIASGAEYSEHWAFVPPRRTPAPSVRDRSWPRNDIDRFILARLEREGLRPSPEADRATLLRRLSLDLVGLQPTPNELDDFLRDGAPGAYERQVERLLASPHYGERWGRHWLDAARYADSDGFEKDKPRFVWFYRDWVTNALNRDLPYDRFVIEQIAGDLLSGPNGAGPTQDQVVATGFLRNSMINEEGGVDPEQFRMEAMFDRMDAVGKAVLGLTIQCMQCHDHKYDPFSQREYYAMFAFLNNSEEGSAAVYTPEQLQARAALFRTLEAQESRIRMADPDWQARLAEWERRRRGDQPEWRIVSPEPDPSGGQKHYVLDDGSILAQGYAPTKHTTSFTVTVRQPVRAVRLELLNDPNLPLGGPGRSIYGLCALTEFKVTARPASGSGAATEVRIASATADANPEEAPLDPGFDDRSNKRRVTGPIAYAVDRKVETAWGLDIGAGRSNVPRKAVFVLEKPIDHPGGSELTFHLEQMHGGWNSDDNQNNNLGRFRFSVTSALDAEADPLPTAVREALGVPAEQRSAQQARAVFNAWWPTEARWAAEAAERERLWRTHPRPASQLVLRERERPRSTHVLQRGDFLKPAARVAGGVPAALHPLGRTDEPGRLALARWLVDRRSPTTARAIVNRVWQAYFGTGLCATVEELGRQSEPPSHPELLDTLAVEFMESGWSLKRLHRRIVTSAVYRQSSRVRPELLRRDPFNRLLARASRLRVEAEIVHDIALHAGGLLNTRVGGTSVYPPAPGFLFLPPASYGPKKWREETGPDRYRRAHYTFRYRSVPHPPLQAFDAPNGDFVCVRRARSNTPLQALVTLNEPLFIEGARALATRALECGPGDGDRLRDAFRRCVSRDPGPAEAQILLKLLADQEQRFASGQADPLPLAFPDPKSPGPQPAGATPARLAAWTAVARVLLNLDETITRE